jgi:hypothetical protein
LHAEQTRTNGSPLPSESRRVSGFIAKFDPAIAKLARGARRRMRKRLPTAVELVYDNYNALAIGFGPTERTSDAVISVAVYARGVNLYFIHGASLADPHSLLEGSGKQGRFLRLTSADQIDDPRVAALIEAAVGHARAPMAPTGRGHTVVKMVSAKQMPRRPSKR